MKCSEFKNCKGCPEYDKDYCEGVKESNKREKKKSKQTKSDYFISIMDDINPLFSDITEFNNQSYRLLLPDGRKFNYYPTTSLLINIKTGYRTDLYVKHFKKYFNFLK
jgi:hypothetical protein